MLRIPLLLFCASAGVIGLLRDDGAAASTSGAGVLAWPAAAPAAIAPVDHPDSRAAALGPLPFYYDLYTFRGPPGKTSVVAAYAVQARHLDHEDAGEGVRYRFDVTLVLADTSTGVVERRDDSVFVSVSRELPGDHVLSTYIEMQATPSRHMFQRVIMSDATTPGVGQLYGSHFPIPDYSGTALMLSDVALGQPEPTIGWHRRGHVLALLPTTQFPGSSLDVYYEIYNLKYGTPYSTVITITDAGGEEEEADFQPVSIRFAGESDAHTDAVVTELRRIETALPNGRYRITVTVENDISGESASRSRFFAVTRNGHRTTLMPAWPHAETSSPSVRR
ncbi:MAG: hypothetical protein ACYC28_00750 [Longimicrobiales bacterium]